MFSSIWPICPEFIEWIHSARGRRLVFARIVRFGMIATFPFMAWVLLMCITGSESPMLVLLSSSMEPLLKKGYVLVLHRKGDAFRVGEIVSFDIKQPRRF
ncbi:hypothetical protein Syun_005406 [Stephania yunnanensis]|uniref:Signal peptidase complex catalytic subunit SEC11 n=1 Tax=Stephania yunnanensis TaxID=152371 RepID=A0AAP0L8U1_9MAGN